MTEYLTLDEGTIAYDLSGAGPLVVLAHGMGDSRHSYRFVVPALVAAGYRVANVDLRGCGESSTGWRATAAPTSPVTSSPSCGTSAAPR